MVFPIVGGNESTSDLITNSLRVNHGDSPFLSRTISSTGNERTATISVWVKRALFGTEHTIFSNKISSSGINALKFVFFNDDELSVQIGTTGNTGTTLTTNRKFRDPSAWYHLMAVIDTTQSTEANRVRIYVNGQEETSFSESGYPSQNADVRISNSSYPHTIGEDPRDNTHFNGYLSEMHFVDGTALTPSSFGETNDNGVWVPIKYTGSYGTNGFHLQFKQTGTSQNSSGIGADTSGNGNHFAVSNLAATDVTIDTPLNNFSTGDPLILIADGNITPSFSEGNTKWTSGANASYGTSGHGNMAVTNGKWYWEMKIDAGRNNGVTCGIAPTSVFENHYGTSTSTDYTFARDNLGSYGYQFSNSGSNKVTGSSGGNASSYGSPNWSENDIIGVAMDLDNDTLTFYLNGSSQGEAFSSLPDVYYTPAWYGYYDTVWEFNAGNPYNAISSGNSDANGHGNFEYAVPSGYFALCTKNLAEYG